MKRRTMAWTGVALVAAALLAATMPGDDAPAQATDAPVPVLAVHVTQAEMSVLPQRVPASGNVAAWQEAAIGAEIDGLRLIEVRVNVGDEVTRGQVLARFDDAIVRADLAEADAAVALANAELREADSNARRARNLEHSGALSGQQVEQAVVAAGEVLFRLIEDGRLEWRAAVAMADLDTVVPGQSVIVRADGHAPVRGHVRMLAPGVDARTHDGLVYVDLPTDSTLRAGAFARGEVEIGHGDALTLPDSAVLLRDGFSYVMQVDADAKVLVRKVDVGRRSGARVEIVSGLTSADRVIASGLGFLGDGDTVRVVDDTNASPDLVVSGATP